MAGCAVAETTPRQSIAAARERGRARDMWDTCRELAAEFAT